MSEITYDNRAAYGKNGVDLSGHIGRGVVLEAASNSWTTQAGTIDATAAVPEPGLLLSGDGGDNVNVAIGGIVPGAVGGEAFEAGMALVLGPNGKWMSAATAVAALDSQDPFFVAGHAHTACTGDGANFAINLDRRYWSAAPYVAP